MADVFLSYKREDRSRAEPIVEALRAGGLSVWWDQGLTPRQAWDATIEQEIAAAKNVVVLWSESSAASDWVRTEAHYAQERGKLVPVRIEPCSIPLAFTLKQSVNLSHWRGDVNDPAWRKLLGWLEIPAAPPQAAAAMRSDEFAGKPKARNPWIVRGVIGALALAILAVAGFALFRGSSAAPAVASIRVEPFAGADGDAATRTFAQGFAADLAKIVTTGGARLKVFDAAAGAGGKGVGSEYVLNGAVRNDGTNLHASLTLNTAADGAIIWSTDLSRPMAQADAMHQEAEVRMGAVFVCALDEAARNRAIVSLDALKVYLQACEALPVGDAHVARKLLQDLVSLAPRFAQGWGLLAEWNGFLAGLTPDDPLPDVKKAEDAAAHALALDPRNASAWVARAMVKTSIADWPAAQADLDKALSLDPDEPIGNYFYASNLLNVGRTNEALDYARRAANSGPMFEPKVRQVINTLADTGDLSAAQDMLASARRTWPAKSTLLNLAATLAVRYADPSKAGATLDDPEVKAALSPSRLALLRAEAAARADPSPAKQAAAARLIALQSIGPGSAYGAFVHYAVIGRVDDAYAAYSGPQKPLLNAPYVNNPASLFQPFAAKVRADPRFMPLAKRLGLVAIWQATTWPDFCTAQDAPYDCRAAAAR